VKVTALGTGDAFSADRYSSCLLIETGTSRVLVDCPHPIRKVLKESTGGRVDVGDIDAVILTHLHADHASGVEGFAWFCRFVLGRPMRLFAHEAVLAGLSTQHAVTVGGLQVSARLTAHHIPTTALFFDDGSSQLGYSADTAFDPELIAWLARADVVIHETNFGAHTPYAKLAALPEATRRKLHLIHWPDGFDAAASTIPVLHDGDVVEVSARG
jgi:ribonuclease BN (tRNA processing enzyme)